MTRSWLCQDQLSWSLLNSSVSSQDKLALLTLEPRSPIKQGQGSPAESVESERGHSVQRTLSRLQDQLPQDPHETELLLVSVLQRTLSSHSTPQTSRRPSVIKQTPPTTPQHSLAPQEPANTPARTLSEADSVFNSPPHGSTGSATTISGESLFLSKKTCYCKRHNPQDDWCKGIGYSVGGLWGWGWI